MGRFGNVMRPPGETRVPRDLWLRVVLVGTLALVAGLAVVTFATASHVEPVLLPGASNQGKRCADNEGAGQDWIEFKIDTNPDAGVYTDGTLSVTIAKPSSNVVDWTSNIGVDAVIVKGGPDGANLYRYDPPQEETSDTGLTVPSGGISHVSFCYDLESKIIVEKQTNPDGDSQSFGFTSNFAGNFSLSDGQKKDSGNLAPGTYSVSESAVAGWDLTSATCSDGSSPSSIGLQAGETVTCTFVNTKRGNIVVKKEASPSDTQQSFSFTASYGNFSLAHGEQNDSGLLQPGTYSVSETVPEGWTLASATCDDGSNPSSIGLSAGETVTCTFVNEQDGEIVVEKQTVPDGYRPQGGPFVFSGDIEASLEDGESASKSVRPGTYSVTEEERVWWDVDIVCDDDDSTGDDTSRTATYRVDPGERVTCVFTNTKRSRIVVYKVTDPEGAEQRFDFESSWGETFTLGDGGRHDSVLLPPGTYSITELPVEGWELESATCDNGDDPSSIELQPSTIVTCTFRNAERQPEPGTIIVEKRTIPAGDPTEFDFTFGEGGFSLSHGEQRVIDGLDAGTYSVSESVPEGWDLTSAVCDDESDPSAIELSEGETVTCVFTNTKRGTIVVEKRTSPAGESGSFTFTGDAAGSIGHGGQIVVPNLVPGTYTSTESAAEGWLLTEVSCDDGDSSGNVEARTATFELSAGETVTCVFTNAKIATGKGAITVTKSASPTSVKEPGGSVTYTVTIRNTSDVLVTIENVVDDRFGDLDDSGGNGCFDVPINLAPGADSFCQFVGQVTGAAGTSHVNVVTATGTDEFGNPVSDSDDARVEITPKLIDLVIDKTASSPTPLNGTVTYTMTVTNKGPDTATNVQLADPAPAGITLLTATPSQGTCSVAPALVTCNLGTIAPGQTVTVNATGRATAFGTHVNTATVSGEGGRETNPADNTDSAQTVVPRPIQPPTPEEPKPEPAICLTLTVTPKTITADGKPDKVRVLVTAAKKRQKGVKVVVKGVGVSKTGRTAKNGVAVMTINPKKAGLLTVTVQERDRKACGPARVGVVGVFLPPLTG